MPIRENGASALTKSDGLLRLLPKSEMTFQRIADGRVVVGAHQDRAGYRYYSIFEESDLPNNLVSENDLERIIIDPVERRAIAEG